MKQARDLNDHVDQLTREDSVVREREAPSFPGIGKSSPSAYLYAVEKPTRKRLAEVDAWLSQKDPLPPARVDFAQTRGRR